MAEKFDPSRYVRRGPAISRVYSKQSQKMPPDVPCEICDGERWGMILHGLTRDDGSRVKVCEVCFLELAATGDRGDP